MTIEQIDESGWPTGENSPLLILPMSPDQLSKRFNLVFSDDRDGLGDLKIAVVRSQFFGIAGLIRHQDEPSEGTTVYVNSEADLPTTCRAVLSEFGLAESDVSWITTELRRE
ncbi:hypothetical protein ABZ345_42005 [Lentzea sp. NPDC005914]|uniref:hypothetical protein n=1 Tax=Lentzea sp. NPDC005914 TaxID=3154572 RepID=UPI0033EE1729